MSEQVMREMGKAMGLPEATPLAVRPRVETVPPPAAPQPGAGKLLIDLDAALGALPTRFWRDARVVARRLNCEEQLTAVEDAHDAVVSARE